MSTFMLDVIMKSEPVEGCKRRGYMVKATGVESDIFPSILRGHKWGKIAFLKAREKDVVLIEMRDDRSLDMSFMYMDG